MIDSVPSLHRRRSACRGRTIVLYMSIVLYIVAVSRLSTALGDAAWVPTLATMPVGVGLATLHRWPGLDKANWIGKVLDTTFALLPGVIIVVAGIALVLVGALWK